MKIETFDQRRTETLGLWWKPENNYYMSSSISLATLKRFKGCVRFFVKKNRFFVKGENRPNYIMWIADSKADGAKELGVEEAEVTCGEFGEIFCSACGVQLTRMPFEMNFCPACGAKFSDAVNSRECVYD